jgi:diguanylate cyclase
MGELLESQLRSPAAYTLARQALEEMEAAKVWPTPLNFELWLSVIAEPEGPLGCEVRRLLTAGQPITEAISEDLAAQFLSRLRFTEEIRDAGDQLSKQLESISVAIDTAQRSSAAYGRTLAGASRELSEDTNGEALKGLVTTLADATRRVQRQNSALERRLTESTREVRRLREHLEQVRRDAMTDALTLLANRKAFDEALDRACAEGETAPLTLAMIDIDHFKRFNDTWGHQTGDQVIRYVASVIGRMGAAPRMASRYGGEEFAVLFPSERIDQVLKCIEGIRVEIGSRMLKRRSTNEDLGAVTISAGLAQRLPGESALSLIERADRALYASKRGGRDRTTEAEGVEVAAA